MNDEMKPEQALKILESATSSVNTTREGHHQILTALETLRNMLTALSVAKAAGQ